MNPPREVQFTFLACADLKAIWESIAMPTYVSAATASDDLAAARAFAEAFARHCELIAQSPELGDRRDEIQHGICSSAFQRYVIFYRARGACVEVMRVLRAARDAGRVT